MEANLPMPQPSKSEVKDVKEVLQLITEMDRVLAGAASSWMIKP